MPDSTPGGKTLPGFPFVWLRVILSMCKPLVSGMYFILLKADLRILGIEVSARLPHGYSVWGLESLCSKCGRNEISHIVKHPVGTGTCRGRRGPCPPTLLSCLPRDPFHRTVGKTQCGCPAVPGSRGGSCGSFFHAGHSFSLERGCKQQFPPGLKEVLSTHTGSPGAAASFSVSMSFPVRDQRCRQGDHDDQRGPEGQQRGWPGLQNPASLWGSPWAPTCPSARCSAPFSLNSPSYLIDT